MYAQRAICVGMLRPVNGDWETSLNSCLIDPGALVHHVELRLVIDCRGTAADCPYSDRATILVPAARCGRGVKHAVSFASRRTMCTACLTTSMCGPADEERLRYTRGGVVAMVDRRYPAPATDDDPDWNFLKLSLSPEQLHALERMLLGQLDAVAHRVHETTVCPSTASGYNYLGYFYKLVRALCCRPCGCPGALVRNFACGTTRADVDDYIDGAAADPELEFPCRAFTCDELVATSLMVCGYLPRDSDPVLMSPHDVWLACQSAGATVITRDESVQ
jgi:hypothetical protein